MSAVGGVAPARVRDVLRLAWPLVLSYVCNSLYRVNDQYWVGDLGPDAHAALGGCVFLLILNFSCYFLVIAGALPLVAKATGAADPETRDRTVRHAMALGAILALVLGVVGRSFTPQLIDALGLTDGTAVMARSYMNVIYAGTLPMALAPLVDTVFIGMGNTLIPFLLQLVAVLSNFTLNPCLIYGYGPFEEYGVAGAAIATCISRSITTVLGLIILWRSFGVHWMPRLKLERSQALQILRIGFPSALSITIYASIYLLLLRTVITGLGRDVIAGLGIGFNAFEGVSFPLYLGVAVAGSSIIGRNMGAGSRPGVIEAVRSVRIVAIVMGIAVSLFFYFVAPSLVRFFTTDVSVAREATGYLRILAFSQLFVAVESVNEKFLLGAGRTKPIFWISVPGNALRVPLAWGLAVGLSWGAAGTWWAINVSTFLKAAAFTWIVKRGHWMEPDPESDPAPGPERRIGTD
ncbi:MAG: MATE family multidrug resistance protein [Chlamydiales bacterium]